MRVNIHISIVRRLYRWDIQGKPKIDFAKVMDLKNSELERLSKLYKSGLDGAGVTFIEGRGKITGKNTVEVNGKSYTVSLLRFLSVQSRASKTLHNALIALRHRSVVGRDLQCIR